METIGLKCLKIWSRSLAMASAGRLFINMLALGSATCSAGYVDVPPFEEDAFSSALARWAEAAALKLTSKNLISSFV